MGCAKISIIAIKAVSGGRILGPEKFVCTFAGIRIKKASPAQIEKAKVILAIPSL